MIIKSINDKTDLSDDLRFYFLSNLCECNPSNVSRLAEALTKEKVGDTLVIVTETIYFHSSWKLTDSINQEYRRMQLCVENGEKVCAVLGIAFHVKEEKQQERRLFLPRSKRGNFSAVYTITLSNIDTDQLLARADAYKTLCEDHDVEHYRKDCSSFYQRISASPVVVSVASAFVKKIKDMADKKFTNTFLIHVKNQSISLGGAGEIYVSFSFAENGLTTLPEKNQRVGFCLAVIDEITSQLSSVPVLGRRNDFIGQLVITNKVHLISHSSEEFELVFAKETQESVTSLWY